jgi:[protein-PII] uridylyltransferase
MGFDANDSRVIAQMVRHHLLLPETATRRDLSDPRTASNVAEAVGDLVTLELLRALTEADSLATGPSAWSAWKASLIDELVERTGDVIRHGAPERTALIVPAGLTALAAAAGAGEVQVVHVASDEVDLVRVAGADRSGLFATIAGVLALRGLDVLGAAAFTVGDASGGTAIDEFRVTRVPGRDVDWDRVEADLRAALVGTLEVGPAIEHMLRQQSRRRRAMSAVPARLEILVSNDESDSTTMVEVRAPDAPVVLYRVAHALSALGLDIRSAVVATLGHEVVDVFYVTAPGAHSPAGHLPTGEFDVVRSAVREALAD